MAVWDVRVFVGALVLDYVIRAATRQLAEVEGCRQGLAHGLVLAVTAKPVMLAA